MVGVVHVDVVAAVVVAAVVPVVAVVRGTQYAFVMHINTIILTQ